jgi:hypothetical protein
VTHPSKNKTRSVAAIGNGCVIPAKAGIQRLLERFNVVMNDTGFPLSRE